MRSSQRTLAAARRVADARCTAGGQAAARVRGQRVARSEEACSRAERGAAALAASAQARATAALRRCDRGDGGGSDGGSGGATWKGVLTTPETSARCAAQRCAAREDRFRAPGSRRKEAIQATSLEKAAQRRKVRFQTWMGLAAAGQRAEQVAEAAKVAKGTAARVRARSAGRLIRSCVGTAARLARPGVCSSHKQRGACACVGRLAGRRCASKDTVRGATNVTKRERAAAMAGARCRQMLALSQLRREQCVARALGGLARLAQQAQADQAERLPAQFESWRTVTSPKPADFTGTGNFAGGGAGRVHGNAATEARERQSAVARTTKRRPARHRTEESRPAAATVVPTEDGKLYFDAAAATYRVFHTQVD